MGLKGSLRNVSTGVSAIPDSVVDNFQDADGDPAGVYEPEQTLDDYYAEGVSGALSQVSRDTIRAISGTTSLNGDDTDGTRSIYSTANDGLNRYPEKGEIFHAYVYGTGNERLAIGFGVDNNGDGYWAQSRGVDNEYKLGKGAFAEDNILIPRTSVSIPTDDWHIIEIEWHDGSGSEPDNEIVFNLYDTDENDAKDGLLVSDSVNDSDFAAETGVGWNFNMVSGETQADQYEVIGHVSD